MMARLEETQRAAAIQREDINQQPRFAKSNTEEIISATQLPERAKRWLREHPEYIQDISKNATIIALHDVAKRQAGSEWDDRYFEKMEGLLGLRPEPQRNSNGTQQSTSRKSEPVRQRYAGPPVSAMPSRDIPSMSSGRPTSYHEPMTMQEAEIARASGISNDEYRMQKEKLMRLKASGVIPDGR
jgi:hypothetical protein